MKILIFAEAITLAHFLRSLTIAKNLIKAGHEVMYVSTNAQAVPQKELVGINFLFIDSPVTPAVFGSTLEVGKHPYTEEILDRYLEQDRELIKQFKPDILMGDMRLSLHVTSEVTGIPFINITNSYWDNSAIIPARFPMFKDSLLGDNLFSRTFYLILNPLVLYNMARPFNSFAKKNKVNLYGNYKDVITKGTSILYCDYHGLVKLKNNSPEKNIIGPLIYETAMDLPVELKDKSQRKKVFVGLGSSGPAILLDKIIEVLIELDVDAIICSPDKKLRSLESERIKFYDFLPYTKIAEHVDLFICNGGSSVVYAAILGGAPSLMLPLNFDQVLFSALIEELNCGLVLRTDEFSKERFKKSITSILGNELQYQSVSKVQKELKNVDPVKNIINVVATFDKKERSA